MRRFQDTSSTGADLYYYYFLYLKVSYEYKRSRTIGCHDSFVGYSISGDLNVNQGVVRDKRIYDDCSVGV